MPDVCLHLTDQAQGAWKRQVTVDVVPRIGEAVTVYQGRLATVSMVTHHIDEDVIEVRLNYAGLCDPVWLIDDDWEHCDIS